MAEEYDAIIIGGGHNGLTCGAYLAKAGKKVIVLERRDLIGGGAMTEELTLPGFKHNTHSYMHSYIFKGPVFEDLELENHGCKYVFPDPIYGGILSDNRCLIVYQDLERTCKEIAKFSKHDAEGWREMCTKFSRFRDVLLGYFFSPPAPTSQMYAVLETTPEGREMLEIFASTCQRAMDYYIESPEVQAALWILSEQSGVFREWYGGGMFLPLFTSEMHRPRGMGHAVGGSISLSLAMGRAIEAHGGEVRKNAQVEKVIVEDKTATGVELADGTVLKADIVVSNIRYDDLLLNKVGKEHLDPDVARRARSYLGSISTGWIHLFTPHWALNEQIEWKCAKDNPDIQKCPSVGLCETLPEQDRFHADVFMSKKIPWDHLSFIMELPTVVDPTQAPSGKHTAFAWVQAPTWQIAGDDCISEVKEKLNEENWCEEWKSGSIMEPWKDQQEAFSDACEKKISEYAVNWNKNMVLGRFSDSVYEQMKRNWALKPNWNHGGGYFQDVRGRFIPDTEYCDYRMPIKNLYLCGPDAHPGLGCTGAPGYLCTNAIAEDFKIKKWWGKK